MKTNYYSYKFRGLFLGLALFSFTAALPVPGRILAYAKGSSDHSLGMSGSTKSSAKALAPQPHLLFSPAPLGSTNTWSGGDFNDGDWTSNGNWAGFGGAGPDDTLVFPQSAARKSNTNNFPVNTRFKSISILGSGYTINGNQIFLTFGIIGNVTATSGANSQFNPNIILDGDQLFTNSGRPLNLNGVLNLDGHHLAVSGTGSFVFNGSITGGGFINVNTQDFGNAVIKGNASSVVVTQVDAGQLCVLSPGSSGPVNLNKGSLCGNGAVGSLFALSTTPASIDPGTGSNTAGILTANGDVLMSTNTTLNIDLNGFTVGTQYDRLRVVNGDVSLNLANLSLSVTFLPSIGSQFTIIQDTGGVVTGQFAQGSSITADGTQFSITYTGNSVVLTAVRHVL